MKLLLHYRASPEFRNLIERSLPDDMECEVVDEKDTAAFARALPETEAILHVLEPITADMIAAAPKLKLIQKIGVGVNTIDLDAARKAGVAVANMPGTNSAAVAEAALALILGVLRRVTYLDPLTRKGQGWEPDLALMDGIGEVSGRVVGLVGYGAIPQRLAPILAAMGAEVLFTARTQRTETGPARQVDIDTLIAESDIMSLHVPLTSDTEQMIDADVIARMRDGAILINTARGALVDEAALADALRSGKLRGAGLDVFANEPVEPENPLLAMPNVVAMPHVAWLTFETLERSLGIAIENCRRIQAGEELLHHVR